MLEKTEWAIKNGQYRDTWNIRYKTQNEDKHNNTTQKTKMMSGPYQKHGGEPRWPWRLGSSCGPYQKHGGEPRWPWRL